MRVEKYVSCSQDISEDELTALAVLLCKGLDSLEALSDPEGGPLCSLHSKVLLNFFEKFEILVRVYTRVDDLTIAPNKCPLRW